MAAVWALGKRPWLACISIRQYRWNVCGLQGLTCEGKDEDSNGDDPGDTAGALLKLLHEIIEEHAEALEDSIRVDLHHEEGQGHGPAPATFWYRWVNIGTQTAGYSGTLHGYRAPPGGRNRHDGCPSISWLMSGMSFIGRMLAMSLSSSYISPDVMYNSFMSSS